MTYVCLIIALVCCGSIATSSAQEFGTSVIRIVGSGSVCPLIEEYAKVFQNNNPGKSVVISGGQTGHGVKKFLDGNAEIIMASRKLNKTETEAASVKGFRLYEKTIGYGVVAFVVHPSNPVSELTVEQIKQILKGEIVNWRDVGGSDKAVTVIGIGDPASGTRRFIVESLLGGKNLGENFQGEKLAVSICSKIAVEKDAIGFCRIRDISRLEKRDNADSVKIIRVKPDADSPSVDPRHTASSERLYPIASPYYLYFDAKRAPLAQTFVNSFMSQGMKIAKQ
jgi:phosphate transport system substrate-binding protein